MPLRITDIGVTPPGTIAIYLPVSGSQWYQFCRIIGEAYHKIPGALQVWSHDTMLTDVPSPLTSRPSGLDNYEFSEVLFTSKLSCISLNNKKKMLLRRFEPLQSWTRQKSFSRSASCANCWVMNENFICRCKYRSIMSNALLYTHARIYATTPPREQLC